MIQSELKLIENYEVAKAAELDLETEETQEKKEAVLAQLSNSNEDTARND